MLQYKDLVLRNGTQTDGPPVWSSSRRSRILAMTPLLPLICWTLPLKHRLLNIHWLFL